VLLDDDVDGGDYVIRVDESKLIRVYVVGQPNTDDDGVALEIADRLSETA
jgi:hypothetical protein